MSEHTYLRLWEANNTTTCVSPDDEHTIDAAVTRYLDTGRDELLLLTTYSGDRYRTRASLILSLMLSTPEGRAKDAEIDKELGDEARETRLSLGLSWDEEND